MSTKTPVSRPFSSTLPKLVGFGSIILMLGGFGAWAMRAEIDGAVLAGGRIIVDRNRQAVQHPNGGVIEEILVKEGDAVAEGDVLLRLDPTVPDSELAIVEGQLYELMARRGRLEAERDERDTIVFDPILLEAMKQNEGIEKLVRGQERLFDARRDSLNKSLNQLVNQMDQLGNLVDGIDAQTVAVDRQLDLVASEVTSQESLLSKGLAQKSRVLALHREDARLAGMKGGLAADRAQTMQQIAENNIQQLRLHAQRREEAITILRDLQFNEMEMAERRRSLLTQLNRLDIRAPVSGIIYDLKVFGPKSVIRPADAVMYIIPQDKPLVIEARVDPIDVNKLFERQEVILRFSAFDMRSTPDLFGHIVQVSPDAFTDAQSGRSFYRAEINLPQHELAKLSEDQVLIPGMPVETFIRTGAHTPFTYLTSPLTRYLQRAMKDGA